LKKNKIEKKGENDIFKLKTDFQNFRREIRDSLERE